MEGERYAIIHKKEIKLSTFYKHALTGTFFEWVHNGMRVPPKEFFEKLSNVTRKV